MSFTPLPSTADIIIAGGGPAGATLGRLLAELGYRVVIFEKRRFPRHQIGESLTPQILPILDFLGVRSRVEAAGFPRMAGHTVCWGNSQPRTSYYSEDHSRRGFQVWREDFDALVLDHARAGGVEVFEEQSVDHVQFADDGVMVAAAHATATARFFVDATGHAGILARQRLRQRDQVFQTLAINAYWHGASDPPGVDFANTLIEAYENGLVWSVPLHNGLRNVTLLIDWELGTRIRQSGLQEFYFTELRQAPYIGQFLYDARLAIPPRAFDATWHTAARFVTAQFLLVGDAGVFIDPLSSEGVHKAMASAITGAAVINTILQRPSMIPHAVDFYEGVQRSLYEAYYRQSAAYYHEEQRWPDAPFWRRRSQQQVQGSDQDTSAFRIPHSAFRTSTIVSHLSVGPDVRVEPRPVIEGPFVEVRDVLITPRHPRGLRFLDGITLPTLIQLVERETAVAQIIPAYLSSPAGQHCTPEAVRQMLARLYYEGVLTAIAPDESRSG
jgi:flavin-dependent dehydrogenase